MFSCVRRHPLFNRIIFSSIHTVRFTSSSKPLSLSVRGDQFLPYGTEQDNERLVRLEAQVKEAQQPRARSSYRPADRNERRGYDGTLRCTSCKMLKVYSSFYIRTTYKYGHSSMCKMCMCEQQRHHYGCTLRGKMTNILNHARGSASRRAKMPSREEAGHCELSLDFLLTMWQNQQARCAYSDIVMSLECFTSWSLSLERLDNNQGYVPGNVAFICVEFNTADHSRKVKSGLVTGSSKWSRSKLQFLPDEIGRAIPVIQSKVELVEMLHRKRESVGQKQRSTREKSAEGLLLCTSCQQFKNGETDFHAGSRRTEKRNWCKNCCYVWRSTYTKSFGGFLKSRLLSAKSCARVRKKNGRISAGEFDLTIDDILSMYQQQKGLCFYSGVRLCLQSSSEWMCSIERFDNKKGYLRSNVALICAEFQTPDYSYCATEPVKGSAQWSREKVEMVVQWLRRNPAQDS